MTKSTELRADGGLAGSMCASKRMCPDYARYAVSYDADGLAADPVPSCARHLPKAIMDVWQGHHRPAVIQEVPGAWRNRVEGVQTHAREQ